MRIAVIGNCHADIVAQSVRAAIRDQTADCRHIISYKTISDTDRAFVEAADRILIQITDFKPDQAISALIARKSDMIGRFPLIAASFLYPGAGKPHPKAAASRSFFCPSGYYEGQLSERLLIDLMQAHADEPPEAIVERYLAHDYAATLDLDRLFEINRLKMRRIGEAAGLDVWPLVERRFRDIPLFWTYLHPSGDLLRPIARHALNQLNLGLTPATIEVAIGEIKEPLGFSHMPLHPSIVRHFGIEWAGPAYRYRLMPDGRFTAAEFAIRFITFAHDAPLRQAVFDVHRHVGVDAAVKVLEAARSRSPDNGDVLINLAIGFWKLGQLNPAIEATTAALELDPTQTEWVRFLCILLRQARLV